jgi:hypothetical protein
MKTTLTAIILFLLTLTQVIDAQTFPRAEGLNPSRGTFGMGVIIGEPTGLSGKYWLGGNRALDFAFGASFFTDYRLHGMYLFHVDAFGHQRVPLHYGLGVSFAGGAGKIVRIGRGTETRSEKYGLGPRGTVGISYLVPSAPFDLFTEIGAVLFVVPSAVLALDLSLGARYYF